MRPLLAGRCECGGDNARIPAPRIEPPTPDLPPRMENVTLFMLWETQTELELDTMVVWTANRTTVKFADNESRRRVGGASPLELHIPREMITEAMRAGDAHIEIDAVSWRNWPVALETSLRFVVGAEVWYEDPVPS